MSITGVARVDEELRRMIEADRGQDYEEAHLAEDHAMMDMIGAVADGVAGPAECARFQQWLLTYDATESGSRAGTPDIATRRHAAITHGA